MELGETKRCAEKREKAGAIEGEKAGAHIGRQERGNDFGVFFQKIM